MVPELSPVNTTPSFPVAGCQTPTLAMIAKREEEIRKFVPKEYYGISLETQDVKWTWRDEKQRASDFFQGKGRADQRQAGERCS